MRDKDRGAGVAAVCTTYSNPKKFGFLDQPLRLIIPCRVNNLVLQARTSKKREFCVALRRASRSIHTFLSPAYQFLLMDNACQCILLSACDYACHDFRPTLTVMEAPPSVSRASCGSAARRCGLYMSNGADERGQADHFQAAWANGEQRALWMTSR
jgi:hypothetical protein